jgi:hypothetical protein
MAAMADAADTVMVRPRPRKARGQERPVYLDNPDLDRVTIMLVGLMAEVSALRDRLDTHEALAELGAVATTGAVERYTLDPDRREARDRRRDAMLDRVLRVLFEERDAAPAPAGD